MNIYEKLMNIQSELKAPKSQFSKFGNYNYRSCEDILEALKPILIKYKVILVINDEVVQIGDRYYIKATSTLVDAEKGVSEISSTAYAREDENKAKMDLSQMTGSASSYARKYSLNGLFAIDDTKDADGLPKDKSTQTTTKATQKQYGANNKTTDKDLKDIKDNSLADKNTLNQLYNMAKFKNYTAEAMSKYIKEVYGKDSSKDLTNKEVLELIEIIKSLKTEENGGKTNENNK